MMNVAIGAVPVFVNVVNAVVAALVVVNVVVGVGVTIA